MTEHHSHHEVHQNNDQKAENFGTMFIAGSVLLAAVLISASVLYSGKIFTKALVGGNFAAGTEENNQALPPQNQAALPSNPKLVDFQLRDSAASLGKSSAGVTLVEFVDFQCPFCKRYHEETFSQIKSKFVDSGKIKLIAMNYPLPFHQNAQKAGEAAECANDQGKFWEYQDLLFKNGQGDGTGLTVDDLKKYADSLGLNNGTFGFGKNKFNACLDSGEKAQIVKDDMQAAQTIGVSGTPSFAFLVKGEKVFDVNFIQNQLQQQVSVVKLDNGNAFVVGAQPFANFEQLLNDLLAL